MSLEIRPITLEEHPAFWQAIHIPFGEHQSALSIDQWHPLFEFDRTLAAFDQEHHNEIVATAGAFSFELTLPGMTTLPVAGVTWVGVQPTHRRQGLLTALMHRQLEDIQARGEAVAILNASESAIYGRFGYGQASQQAVLEIDRRDAAFAGHRQPETTRKDAMKAGGRLNLISHEEALTVLPGVYDRVRLLQPGAINRSSAYWAVTLDGPPEPVDGFGSRYYVTYTGALGEVDGLAHYRLKPNWDQGFPAHTLQVNELLATTPEAYAGLWQYLLSVDLVQTIRAVRRPSDEPLKWLLADPRRLRIIRVADELWVRLLDIPAALAARRYRASGRLLFDVADAFRPQAAGRYLLEAGPDGATCTAGSKTANKTDLALDVADLGATYLGGVSFTTLARAGRVVEKTPGALARADLLFSTDQAPYCGSPF